MDAGAYQLTTKELEQYKKAPGSIWFKTTYELEDPEYGKIEVTRLSPYPSFPKDQRPDDYFNRIETILNFKDFHSEKGDLSNASSDIVIKISGKGRQELIEVTINGEPMEFEGSELIFNLNKTFTEENMVLLLKKAQRQSDATMKIGDTLEVWTALDLVPASHQIVQLYFENLKNTITELSEGKLSKIFIPVVTRGRPFDPNHPETTGGHHWYTCVLSLEDPKIPVMTLIDSTNKLKGGLEIKDIIHEYHESIAIPLNNVLKSLGINEIEPEQIRYAQGTQYGNMGCGITASLNIERLISGGTFEALTESSPKTAMTYPNVMYYDHNSDEHFESNITRERLVELQQTYGEDNVIAMQGRPSFPDISVKRDIAQEALQRFELARQISFKQKFEKNMAIENAKNVNIMTPHQVKADLHSLLRPCPSVVPLHSLKGPRRSIQ